MIQASWHAFYYGELQSVYALLVVPLAFLVYRLVASPQESKAVVPAASRFVSVLTLVFAIETMLDPIATGPLLKKTVLGETIAASVIPFLFVYLGDLRVLLLAIGVARADREFKTNLRAAGLIALIVPVYAGVAFSILERLAPESNDQWLWMFHESAFLLLCIGLGRVWVPRHSAHDPQKAAFLRSIFGYSAAYYALWLSADVLIVLGGLDLGWAIRMIPNQLYYAFWIPFVYARFYSLPPAKAPR